MIGVAMVETCLLLLSLGSPLVPATGTQVPAPRATESPARPAGGSERLGLPTEPSTGWPSIGDVGRNPSPASDIAVPVLAAPPRDVREPVPAASPMVEPAPSRGVAAGLPPASAFRSLGGIAIWWRLTVYGPQGETMATREFAHRLDASVSDRDRLEFADGRVYGRLGPAVFAQRNRMPWLTLVEPATHELELFGLHARLPYIVAEGQRWVALGSRREPHGSETWEVLCFQGRSRNEVVGPSADATPSVDRLELCLPTGGGLPRECRVVWAASGQPRRVRLEDWREVASVPIPFRRVYIDESGRPTTALDVLRFEPGATTSDRDFRLD